MVWLKNFMNIHHRIMARFLRKRGWVVFYLEESARECKDMCWLKLYQDEQANKPDDKIKNDYYMITIEDEGFKIKLMYICPYCQWSGYYSEEEIRDHYLEHLKDRLKQRANKSLSPT